MCKSAEEALGVEERRSPHWYREREIELNPLFEKRNKLHKKWLSSGKEWDRQKFKKACREARWSTSKQRTIGLTRKHSQLSLGDTVER